MLKSTMFKSLEFIVYTAGLCALGVFVFSPAFDYATGSPRMCSYKGEQFKVAKGYKCPLFTKE